MTIAGTAAPLSRPTRASPWMRTDRCARAALLAAAVAFAPACVTTSEPKDGMSSTVSRDTAKGGGESAPGDSGQSGVGRAGKIAATVPANIVWIPWKIVGSGLKGASDGVHAGFDKGRGMPLLAVLFSPVNLAAGLVTGIFEGAAMPPLLIGPDDNFGRTFSSPTSRATTIWWYE